MVSSSERVKQSKKIVILIALHDAENQGTVIHELSAAAYQGTVIPELSAAAYQT